MQQNNPTQRYNSYNHLLHITINICASTFIFGFSNSYFNSINFNDIAKIYHLEGYSLSTVQGVLTGILSYTAGFGAYMSKYLIMNFSRKQCLQILSVCTIFMSVLLIFPSLLILFIARCIQGVIIGMISSVSPLYIRQFVPVELSSSLCPWNQIGIASGITFSFILTFLLSLFLPVQVYWRLVFGFPIIIAIIQLYNLKFNFPYETPKYLLLQNKEKEAIDLLSVIYKKQHVDEVLKELKLALNTANNRESESHMTQQDLPHFHTEEEPHQLKKPLNQELIEMNKEKVQKNKENTVNKQVTTNPLAKISAIHITICSQMVGMGAIIAYSGEIVGQIIPFIEKIFPIIINTVAVTGAFLTILVLKRFGRKTTYNIGAVGMGLMLIVLALAFFKANIYDFNQNSWFTKASVCVLLLAIRLVFSFSLGPVSWIYAAQIVQPSFIPITTMINWFTVATVNTIFPILKHALGGNSAPIWLFFGIYTFLSYFVNRCILVQTKNKNQYQINSQYQQKWKSFKLL